jgi:hypothetical protein
MLAGEPRKIQKKSVKKRKECRILENKKPHIKRDWNATDHESMIEEEEA